MIKMKSNKFKTLIFYCKIGNLLILFLLISNANVIAQSVNPQTLLRVIQEEADKNKFSGSVIILEDSNLVVSESVGFADRERGKKNELNTKFNIASVGKLFTKIVILQLISEGKISFNDPVSQYYSSFDKSTYNQITIGHLFNHRSGLRDIYTNSEYIDLVKNDEPDFQNKVVDAIANEPLHFTPGSEYKYSNSGFYLLGAIASKVDKRKYEDVVIYRIFEPLHMTNSGFSRTGDYVPDHAKPHELKWFGCKIKEKKTDLIGDRPSGAGGQYSTAQDLAKVYLSLLYDNLLLTETYKGILFGNSDSQSWNDIRNSGKIIGYVGGDTRGWSAKIGFYFLQNKTYGVIITSNFDNMAHELDLEMRDHIIATSKE